MIHRPLLSRPSQTVRMSKSELVAQRFFVQGITMIGFGER